MDEAICTEEAGQGFDERRLQVLVRFSSELRVPMTTIAFVIAATGWYGGVPLPIVLGWLLPTLLIRELRAAALLRLARQQDRPIAPRLRQSVAWSLLLGLAHGAAALFMLRLDTAHSAMLTMILLSLSAGAVSTTYTVRPAFIAYAGALSLPTALLWMRRGEPLDIGIGTLVLMFTLVQIRFATQNKQLFAESFRMRQENLSLLRQLDDERKLLARARDEAVQANLAKSRFLAAASHDLRQPLQSLSLNGGALSHRIPEGPARAVVDEIQQSIEALRQMLDGLLDVSKLDAGAARPLLQAIPIDRLVAGLCTRLRPAAQSKGLTLRSHCPPDTMVMSDIDMLQRILANLIDNAIKFTDEGVIDLHVQRQGGSVVLRVQDSGIGIAPADQARVFEDLVQLGNPHRDRNQGHGLGLGIVRRLTAVLGIGIALHSRPGQGTCIELRLPAAQAGAMPVIADQSDAMPATIARQVLVLDDDAAVRSAYVNALRPLGCTVLCAATVAEAEQALHDGPAEVALVDYRLAGGIDGLQAIARLRTLRPGIGAVIVSADTSPTLHDEARQQRIGVLRKPVTATMLALAITEALQPEP